MENKIKNKWYHHTEQRDKAMMILAILGLIFSLNSVITKIVKGAIIGDFWSFTAPQFTFITNVFCLVIFIAAMYKVIFKKRVPYIGSREALLFVFVHITVTFAIYNSLMFDWSNPLHNDAYPTSAEVAADPGMASGKARTAFLNGELMGWKDGKNVINGIISWQLAMWADVSAHIITPVVTMIYAVFYFMFISIGKIKIWIILLFGIFGFAYVSLALTVGQRFGIADYYTFLDSSTSRENMWYSFFVCLVITVFVYIWALTFVLMNNARVHKIITTIHPEFQKLENDIEKLYNKLPNEKNEIHSYQKYIEAIYHDAKSLKNKKI